MGCGIQATDKANKPLSLSFMTVDRYGSYNCFITCMLQIGRSTNLAQPIAGHILKRQGMRAIWMKKGNF